MAAPSNESDTASSHQFLPLPLTTLKNFLTSRRVHTRAMAASFNESATTSSPNSLSFPLTTLQRICHLSKKFGKIDHIIEMRGSADGDHFMIVIPKAGEDSWVHIGIPKTAKLEELVRPIRRTQMCENLKLLYRLADPWEENEKRLGRLALQFEKTPSDPWKENEERLARLALQFEKTPSDSPGGQAVLNMIMSAMETKLHLERSIICALPKTTTIFQREINLELDKMLKGVPLPFPIGTDLELKRTLEGVPFPVEVSIEAITLRDARLWAREWMHMLRDDPMIERKVQQVIDVVSLMKSMLLHKEVDWITEIDREWGWKMSTYFYTLVSAITLELTSRLLQMVAR